VRTFNAEIRINGEPARIRGEAPFKLLPADGTTDLAGWVFTDASGANCVTYDDGLPATFSTYAVAVLMAKDINQRAAR
jgi:hypothetical protein